MASTISTTQKKDNEKDFLRFMAKLIFIWLSWKLIIFVLGIESKPIDTRLFPALSRQWENLNNEVRWIILDGSEIVLNKMGYATNNNGYILNIENEIGIGMGNYCIGFQLMYYFIMLVIIARFNWWRTILYSVAGVFITIFINVFRVAGLCWLVVYKPEYMAISHDYIFNAVVLGVLMVFYYFLVRKNTN